MFDALPSWIFAIYDFTDWQEQTAAVTVSLNSTDPDPGDFRSSVGKSILAHNWSDPALMEPATRTRPGASPAASLLEIRVINQLAGSPSLLPWIAEQLPNCPAASHTSVRVTLFPVLPGRTSFVVGHNDGIR